MIHTYFSECKDCRSIQEQIKFIFLYVGKNKNAVIFTIKYFQTF